MGDAFPRARSRADDGGFHRACLEEPSHAGTRGWHKAAARERIRAIPRSGPEGDRTVILFACALITAGTLFYIFYMPGEVYSGGEKTRLSYLQERKDAVYENLRDLNFEYKAGKVPDVDYQTMKASLEDEAAALLAEMARLEQPAVRNTIRS